MSDFKYTSSRCTTHLEIKYIRREGSIYAVLLNVDGKPVLRVEPNGLGQFADWLRNNAEVLEQEHAANTNVSTDPRLEGGM
jgi:hypothetical protein